MSPVDGAGSSNPNLPVDRAVTEGRVPGRASEGVPGAARSRLPGGAARADRAADVALPRPPLGLDPGPLGGAGALRLVHPGRDPPGRRGDAGDPGLPGVGRQLLRPPAHRERSAATGSRSAPTSAAGCAAATICSTPSRPRPRATTTSSSPASSASAPATSPRWPRSTSATTARSRRPRPARRSGSSRPANPCSQTRTSPPAPSPATLRGRRAEMGRCVPKSAHRPGGELMVHELETRVLLECAEDPALRTLDRLQTAGRRLRHAGEGLPRDGAGRGAEGARRLGPARARRRRLLDGQKGLLPAPRRNGQVPLLQRRRVRARRLQGPRADAAQPAPADRGDRDRRPRRRRRPRLHLHPRRVRPPGRHPRRRGRRSVRGRLPGDEHPRLPPRPGAGRPPRRRRLHLRRGDGAARRARGQARQPAPEAAVPGRPGPLWRADADQQRRDALQRAADRRQGRRLVQGLRHRAVAGDQGRLGLRRRAPPRQLRGRARDPDPRS